MQMPCVVWCVLFGLFPVSSVVLMSCGLDMVAFRMHISVLQTSGESGQE